MNESSMDWGGECPCRRTRYYRLQAGSLAIKLRADDTLFGSNYAAIGVPDAIPSLWDRLWYRLIKIGAREPGRWRCLRDLVRLVALAYLWQL